MKVLLFFSSLSSNFAQTFLLYQVSSQLNTHADSVAFFSFSFICYFLAPSIVYIVCLFPGQMRSLRLFYSDSACSAGQVVIASRESQYKILHFHNGGLDRLAEIFQEWSLFARESDKAAVKNFKTKVRFAHSILFYSYCALHIHIVSVVLQISCSLYLHFIPHFRNKVCLTQSESGIPSARSIVLSIF